MDICHSLKELNIKYFQFWYSKRKLHPNWNKSNRASWTYDENTSKQYNASRILRASELDYMRHLGRV